MSSRDEVVARAVEVVRSRIASLGGHDVEIVGVAKGFPWSDVRAAMAAGVRSIGENYAQEIVGKYGAVPVAERPEIHFIGRLQSNKVAQVAPFVGTWQTVDRVRLLDAIARHAPGAEVLVQVNATGENDKGGCAPSDVEGLVHVGRDLGLRMTGVMTVGPTSGDRAKTRAAFATAARIRAELGLTELSMGMSADFDLAVEMGATMVRLGSVLFGSRPPKI